MQGSNPNASCLVHIGFYKSASTWLQKRYFTETYGFERVMDSLQLQLDVLAPQGENYQAEVIRTELADAFAQVQQRGLCPVISSEGLSGDLVRGGHTQADLAKRMGEVLGDSPRILLVVREQRQLLRSAYKTLVYFGESRPVEKLLQPLAGDEAPRFHPQFLCFDRLVKMYQELFSPEAVLVLPYELFCQQPLDFLTRIRQHAGLPKASDSLLSDLPLSQRLNANEPLGFIESQRLLNKLAGHARNDYQGLRQYNNFERVIRRIAWHKKNSRPLPIDDWLEKRFATKVTALTEGMFSASNQRLGELCGLELGAYGYQLP